MRFLFSLKLYAILFLCVIFLQLHQCNLDENYLPVCKITSPSDGDTLHLDSLLLISVEAYDLDGELTVVEVLVNGVSYKLEGISPYELEISPEEIGSNSCEIQAMVMDNESGLAWDTIRVWFKKDTVIDTLPVKDISGVLERNTFFTKDTLWHVVGNLLVDVGIELHIEPGTIVSFTSNLEDEYSGYSIYIKGTLLARGMESDRIVFRSDNLEEQYWGRLDFKSESSDWDSVSEEGSIIEFCEFHNGGKNDSNAGTIFTDDAYPLVKDNVFYNSRFADVISHGSHNFSKTTVLMNNRFSAFVVAWCNLEFRGNIMEEDGLLGLEDSYKVLVEGNTFRNTYENYGIDLNGSDMSNVQIINNDFQDCNICIRCYYVKNPGIIKYNNFENSKYGVYLTGTVANIDATENYWGTSDSLEIPDHIYDYYDNFDLGEVDYSNSSLVKIEISK